MTRILKSAVNKVLPKILLGQHSAESIYDIPVEDKDGKSISLKPYQGEVMLVVNVASECGFTGQYADLERLHVAYYAQGLRVLAFPCNQFGHQESGSMSQICDFAQNKYRIDFPIFHKTEVMGDKACPLYKHLRSAVLKRKFLPIIPWNFTKFLVGRDGQVIKGFYPNCPMSFVEEEIKLALGD